MSDMELVNMSSDPALDGDEYPTLRPFLLSVTAVRLDELGLTTAANHHRNDYRGTAQQLVRKASKAEPAKSKRRTQLDALQEAIWEVDSRRYVNACRSLRTSGVRHPVIEAAQHEARNHGNPRPLRTVEQLAMWGRCSPEQQAAAVKMMSAEELAWDQWIEAALLIV